jgi:hypothetical protein
VFIYAHKEKSIGEVMARCPADRYVMIDDKRRILSTLKRDHPKLFTTVHILQGHYAHADEDLQPSPDIELPVIADVLRLTPADFLR